MYAFFEGSIQGELQDKHIFDPGFEQMTQNIGYTKFFIPRYISFINAL
jgi:hypothetical protein